MAAQTAMATQQSAHAHEYDQKTSKKNKKQKTKKKKNRQKSKQAQRKQANTIHTTHRDEDVAFALHGKDGIRSHLQTQGRVCVVEVG